MVWGKLQDLMAIDGIVLIRSFGYQCNVMMHAASIQIRHLGAADVDAFRAIRLEGLKCNPEAFGSTFEVEKLRPLTWFSERLDNSAVFGAFHGSELVGVAGFAVYEGAKDAHKGRLWGMYVRASARRAGVGRRLVEAVLDLAGQKVELIQLSVVSENEAALRLYASLGFVEYGIEKHALKQDGRYYDEIYMAKELER